MRRGLRSGDRGEQPGGREPGRVQSVCKALDLLECLAGAGTPLTLGELSRADHDRLAEAFGVNGPRMALRAAGLERSTVAEAAAQEALAVSSNNTSTNSTATKQAGTVDNTANSAANDYADLRTLRRSR